MRPIFLEAPPAQDAKQPHHQAVTKTQMVPVPCVLPAVHQKGGASWSPWRRGQACGMAVQQAAPFAFPQAAERAPWCRLVLELPHRQGTCISPADMEGRRAQDEDIYMGIQQAWGLGSSLLSGL